MRPIKQPKPSNPAPDAPVDRSLRTKLRTGQLSQALSSQETADQREPDELFGPMDPATRGIEPRENDER